MNGFGAGPNSMRTASYREVQLEVLLHPLKESQR